MCSMCNKWVSKTLFSFGVGLVDGTTLSRFFIKPFKFYFMWKAIAANWCSYGRGKNGGLLGGKMHKDTCASLWKWNTPKNWRRCTESTEVFWQFCQPIQHWQRRCPLLSVIWHASTFCCWETQKDLLNSDSEELGREAFHKFARRLVDKSDTGTWHQPWKDNTPWTLFPGHLLVLHMAILSNQMKPSWCMLLN